MIRLHQMRQLVDDDILDALHRGVQQTLVQRNRRRPRLAAPPAAAHPPGPQHRLWDVPPLKPGEPLCRQRREQLPAGLLPPPFQQPLRRLSVGGVAQRQQQPVVLAPGLLFPLPQLYCQRPAQAGQRRALHRQKGLLRPLGLPAPPRRPDQPRPGTHKVIHRSRRHPRRRGNGNAPIGADAQIQVFHPFFLPGIGQLFAVYPHFPLHRQRLLFAASGSPAARRALFSAKRETSRGTPPCPFQFAGTLCKMASAIPEAVRQMVSQSAQSSYCAGLGIKPTSYSTAGQKPSRVT